MNKRKQKQICSEQGIALIEYALLISLIAVVLITGITVAGRWSHDSFRITAIAMEGGGSISTLQDGEVGTQIECPDCYYGRRNIPKSTH